MNATRELLLRLAAHDEVYLQAVLAPRSQLGTTGVLDPPTLDRTVRALVELAALLATDAATPSLRCAVERAAGTGVDDQILVQVLKTAAGAAGTAQTVKSASRLALALDVDTDSDAATRAARHRALGPPPQNVTRPRAFGRRRAPAS
jgi:alkylhydroperoxidase/carboxymuconolactone decarboxylase family protein YurZ